MDLGDNEEELFRELETWKENIAKVIHIPEINYSAQVEQSQYRSRLLESNMKKSAIRHPSATARITYNPLQPGQKKESSVYFLTESDIGDYQQQQPEKPKPQVKTQKISLKELRQMTMSRSQSASRSQKSKQQLVSQTTVGPPSLSIQTETSEYGSSKSSLPVGSDLAYDKKASPLKRPSHKKSLQLLAPILNLRNDSENKSSEKKFNYDNTLLSQNTVGQEDAILKYLFPDLKKSVAQEKIMNEWKNTIKKSDILGPNCDHVAIFNALKYRPNSKVSPEIKKYFGEGMHRRLRPGEEALILDTIRDIINDFKYNPKYIKLPISMQIDRILYLNRMEELHNCPIAKKQIELHYKMMMTRFRCSQKYFDDEELYKKEMKLVCERVLIDINQKDELTENILQGHELRFDPSPETLNYISQNSRSTQIKKRLEIQKLLKSQPAKRIFQKDQLPASERKRSSSFGRKLKISKPQKSSDETK